MKTFLYPVLGLVLLGAGCNRTPSAVDATAAAPEAKPRIGYAEATGEPGAKSPVAYAEPADSAPAKPPQTKLPQARPPLRSADEIASGTVVHVRLLDTLDTKRNRAGDRFTATLDEPLVSGSRVVVPKGTPFKGHIVQARPSGRFKGRAAMALSLDSFELDGVSYLLETTRSARASKGHKKRNWLWIGGGSGGGAAIGAIAGGGAGALIGAGAGAAAGTAGAAITGKRNLTIPVETRLAFTLRSPVDLRR
ncbi:MAG TPA: hypothetical protein VK687_10470 [Bryobacteraceae bacterium]|nr:hypothetical protein [Bryobacteraceae bacterium]